jgi:hypothetical protein
MAEKSIRIADAVSGDRIATRDAFANDDEANTRVVERVDFASGKFSTPIGNAIRGNSAMLTSGESVDTTSVGFTHVVNECITVGDNSMLCVAVEQSVSGGTATITPVLLDNESPTNVVALLPHKTFTQPYAFRRGASSGNYVLPVQTWDISGAYKIGLHLSAITGTSNTVKVFGWVI